MTVKKINILLFLFALSVFPAAGQQAFKLDIKTGFLYGTAYELIYDKNGNSKYTSELQWDIKPLLYTGLTVEYAPKVPYRDIGFYGALGIKLGFPMKTGAMEDRDWLTPASIPGSMTLFSSHDNKTKAAIIADLEPGISLPIIFNFSVRLYLGISYMYFRFEGWNGYTQYGVNNHTPTLISPYVPWDSSWSKTKIRGLGIDYVQHWIILKPGIDFLWNTDYFSARLGVSASPMVGCYAFDNHYMRDPPFQAIFDLFSSLYIEPRADFLYIINKRFNIGLSFSYRHIREAKGNIEQDEYYPSRTSTSKYKNIGGASYKAFSTELVFRVNF